MICKLWNGEGSVGKRMADRYSHATLDAVADGLLGWARKRRLL